MAKIVYVTRRERFSAAHKLWNEKWDAETNLERFGKCSNPNWHGHNYVLYVTAKGVPDPETGYSINLKVLAKVIDENVISKLDHKNLNLDVPFLKGKLTSSENVAIAIWEQLEEPLKKQGCELHSVRLHETENNMVEYFGEK